MGGNTIRGGIAMAAKAFIASAREMKVSQEEMMAENLDPAYRDYCAHLLIPLNQCRRATWYAPWKCGHERHVYEECQFNEHMSRMKTAVEAKQIEEAMYKTD